MSTVDISMLDDTNRVILLRSLWSKTFIAPAAIMSGAAFRSFDTTYALQLIKRGYIDYYEGRMIKSNLSGDTFDTYLYNRDNGKGAAEKIVNELIKNLIYIDVSNTTSQ